MKYEDALSLVKSKRRWAAPNGGFQKQLKMYAKYEGDFELASKAPECVELLAKVKKPVIETWSNSKKIPVEY
jgi:hypothetical protein